MSEATVKWARAVQSVHIVSADATLGSGGKGAGAAGGGADFDDSPNTYLDLFLKAEQQSADHSIDQIMWVPPPPLSSPSPSPYQFHHSNLTPLPHRPLSLCIWYGRWQVEFNNALDCLTPQERRTVVLRYGLGDDGKPRTVARTAELM